MFLWSAGVQQLKGGSVPGTEGHQYPAKDEVVHVRESGEVKDQQSPGSTEDPGETPTELSGAELRVTGHEGWPR